MRWAWRFGGGLGWYFCSAWPLTIDQVCTCRFSSSSQLEAAVYLQSRGACSKSSEGRKGEGVGIVRRPWSSVKQGQAPSSASQPRLKTKCRDEGKSNEPVFHAKRIVSSQRVNWSNKWYFLNSNFLFCLFFEKAERMPKGWKKTFGKKGS